MPNPQTTGGHKPSARRGREAVRERPSARAPVARGVFGHDAESPKPVQQAERREPATGEFPKPSTEGAVLVTGVCGRLGKLLARELHRTDQVVGVDRRPFDDRPKDIVHHQVDDDD